MTIEDILSDVTADLVGSEKYAPFLKRLFAVEPGTWVDAIFLSEGLLEIQEILQRTSSEGTLRVTWLNYASDAYPQGYCMIVFFVEELHWKNIAIFNKQHFLR